MQTWWKQHTWAVQETAGWQLANLNLYISRLEREWQFRMQRPDFISEDRYDWQFLGTVDEAPQQHIDLIRYVCFKTEPSLVLRPVLADRPMVTRPAHSILIAPQVSVTLYISTPVWIQVVGQSSTLPLLDIPVNRPTDSWFGGSTREGDLCYATRIFGRLQLSELEQRPFRAITPVRIYNAGDTPFPLKRLSVPVQMLPLHVSESGRLWTPTLDVTCTPATDKAEIRLFHRVEPSAGPTTLLSPARIPLGTGSLVKALDLLFASRSPGA